MLNKIKELYKKESGAALLLVSLSFTVLLAVAGLAIDGSLLFTTKTELKKVANAAVLSGAQELTRNSEVYVTQVVDDVLTKHQANADLVTVVIKMNDQVTVKLKRDVTLTFSKLLGFETVPVEVDATAKLGVIGNIIGAAPLGVSEDFSFTYGERYFLKVGSGDSNYGEFGVLALEGPGAKTYEETFRNGYNEELKVGDIINSESGNMAGKTNTVVQEKVRSCDDENDRSCERIIIVPVYKPYFANGASGGKVKQVIITGFAYFYLLDPVDEGAPTDTVPGRFLKRTGTGHVVEGAVDRGAYSVQLVK